MENDIRKNLLVKNNLINSHIKKNTISDISLKGYLLTFKLDNIPLENLDEIEVVLKNSKTRNILIAPYTIKNSLLCINLKDLNFLCTDNEFLLLLVIKKHCNYFAINPISKYKYNSKYLNSYCLDLIDITWYLRTLENGELRLSTIIKSPTLNK